MPPAERLREEIDPDSDEGRILFGSAPEDFKDWAETYLTIQNEGGQVVRVRLFPQQFKMKQDETGKDVIVKGRQTRASSMKMMDNVRDMTNGSLWGAHCVVGAQDDKTTEEFRQRIRHHILNDLAKKFDLKVHTDNKDELIVAGLENKFVFVSGEQKTMTRGYAAQRVHLSEFAHWSEKAGELVGGLIPAVGPGGKITMESTPKGEVGAFYNYARDAKGMSSDPRALWTVHLYPWWLEPRYRVAPVADRGFDMPLDPDLYNEYVRQFQPDEHEARLMAEHGLDINQILWRQIRKPEQDRSGVPFLQEYPEDLDTCWLGLEGKFFDTPDGADNLHYYRTLRHDPARWFDKLTYRGNEVPLYNKLAIWESPDINDTYVAGFDTAGGGTSSDSDWSVLYIASVKKEKIVARLRIQATPTAFAAMVAAVCTYYGEALINGEASHHGREVFRALHELQYRNLYYYVDPMKGLKKGQKLEAGMYPTVETRQQILNKFRTAIVGTALQSHCVDLVREMQVFTWQKVQGRLKAMALDTVGNNDDCIFAAAYMWWIIDKARKRLQTRNERPEYDFEVDQNNMVIRPNNRLDQYENRLSDLWRRV
jgi:hypothetical protein